MSGDRRPDGVAWALVVGDDTSASRVREALDGTSGDVTALVLVDGPGAEPDIAGARWVYRDPQCPDPETVVAALRDVQLPEGDGWAWVAAEAGVVRAVLRYLRLEVGMAADRVRADPYRHRPPDRVEPDPTPGSTVRAAERAAELADLLTPYAVRTAAGLGIADLIAGGECTTAGLAAATGCDRTALGALLDHLAVKGVFRRSGVDGFELTDVGRQLLATSPQRESLLMDSAAGHIARAWAGLPHALRTGGAGFDTVFGGPFWTLLNSTPGLAASFDRYLAGWARQWAAPVAGQLDLTGAARVVDVGGGNGTLLAAVLDRYPGLHGTIVELEATAAAAEATMADRGHAGRSAVLAGSFFDPLPGGADAYLLAQVLHDWPDRQAMEILRCCAVAARPRGRVVVVERLVEPDAGRGEHAQMQLMMLNLFGAKERSEGQYASLGEAAGLRLHEVRRTDVGMHILDFRLA